MWTHAINYNTNNDVYYENYSYITSSETIIYSEDITLNAFSYNNNLVVHLQGINYDKYRISIFTSNGQILHDKFLLENESSIILWNIPAGLYIIRAESAKSSKTLKTIVN
jgi:hypothetical protein